MTRKLSPRESEIAELIVQGFKNKQIAEKLNISINTVRSCTSRVYVKLGIFCQPKPRQKLKDIHLNTILAT